MYLNQISKYWDTRAEGYSQTIHQQLAGSDHQTYAHILEEFAPTGEGLSCLDLGCGPGFFSILLARNGHRVTAFDYSEGMLDIARKNFAETGVDVETRQGDAQNLPFADGSFDYIVSRNLVWNLEQPERAYSEWTRVLRPGGKLLIVDANHYLYYYDADYEAIREVTSGTHECYGIDPTPINEIARDLPLSKIHRPEWDMKVLLAMGMSNFDISVSHRGVVDQKTGNTHEIVTDFVLCAKKPSDKTDLTDEELQSKIDDEWTQASDNYSKIVNDELNSFRAEAWTEKILSDAPQGKTLDILDAGCGPAFFSILMAKAGHRVVGLDGSAGMLSYAAKNAAASGVRPMFMMGDCHELPFADGSFDLIISRNVTHALRDQRTVYSEWRRVLRPGGVLLIFDASWHLMQTDPDIRREFVSREDKCFERFGDNFSGGRREVENANELHPHHLGTVTRPGWDVSVLRQTGFAEITTEEDVTEKLWDEKEKLLYGATPMFMIKAVK